MERSLYAFSASIILALTTGCNVQSTPDAHYIAPDVAGGDAEAPDADADISAECVVDCECVIDDPNELPEQAVLDARCRDDFANVIFVDPNAANNRGDGLTPSSAAKTLGDALQKATGNRVYILAAAGVFKERVTLKAGVHIFGGYDAADGWKRKTDALRTTIDPSGADAFEAGTTDYISVVAKDLEPPTLLDHLTIHGPDAQTPGASSYALWAHHADGLSLQNVTIIAGRGKAGRAGEAGQKGEERTCDALGGAGARYDAPDSPVNCVAANSDFGKAATGGDGSAGTLSDGRDAPRNGGEGGAGGVHDCPVPLGVCSPGGGLAGIAGAPGEAADPGMHGVPEGEINTEGLWSGDRGMAAADGDNGTGGGGGGAGGTCQRANGDIRSGTNGGFGGTGGCGGTHGENGQPGGGSFGIFASHSNLELGALVITSGRAGDGGDGAKGGAGQPANNDNRDALPAGMGGGSGGKGGEGGNGANGGDGAGGCGGPSIGIARDASEFAIPQDTVFTPAPETAAGGAHAFAGEGGTATPPCDGLLLEDYDFGG